MRARYASLDAWEVSGLGTLPKSSRANRLVLWQLMVRTKPSHVVLLRERCQRDSVHLRGWRERALRLGLPLSVLDGTEVRNLLHAAPSLEDLAHAYPELRHLVVRPRATATETLRIAAAVLVTRSLPPRRYVPGNPLHCRTTLAR